MYSLIGCFEGLLTGWLPDLAVYPAHSLTGCDSLWQTGPLCNTHTVWLSDWLSSCVTYWLAGCLSDWLTKWQTVWLTDWLVDWLSGFLCYILTFWLGVWPACSPILHTVWLKNWLASCAAYTLSDWPIGLLADYFFAVHSVGLTDQLTDWLTCLLFNIRTVWLVACSFSYMFACWLTACVTFYLANFGV